MPNAPISQVAWYKTWVQVGNFIIPVLGNAVLNCDENFQAPMAIGNFWQFNYVPGLIQPSVDLNLLVRDNANEALSSGFLNLFHTRAGDLTHDTSVVGNGGIIFYDGGDAQQLVSPKAESYSITTGKGEQIGMSVRFYGTDVLSASVPSIPAWNSDPPMNYKNVNFDNSSFKDAAYRFGLSFSNNHYPDNALNGTRGPAQWNAGSPTAGFNCTVQAKKALPSDDSAVSLIIAGNNITRTFTLPRVQCQNRRSRGIQPPQVMRNYRFQCTGGDSQTIAPLYFS